MSELQALLRKAERSFSAAALLLEAENPDFAASRAYYGCFYVAEALLLSEGLRFSRRGQVISQYDRIFAREGRLDRRFHRLLDRAFSMRQAADCTAEICINAGETRQVVGEGRTFLDAARSYPGQRETEDAGS